MVTGEGESGIEGDGGRVGQLKMDSVQRQAWCCVEIDLLIGEEQVDVLGNAPQNFHRLSGSKNRLYLGMRRVISQVY